MDCCAKKPKRRGTYTVVFIIIALCAATLVYLRLVVLPVAQSYSSDRIKARTVAVVNSSVASTLASDKSTADVVKVTFDSENNVTAVSVDTVILNEIIRNVIRSVQSSLDGIGRGGITIPLGTLSGISVVSGVGPEIDVRVIPVGIAEATVATSFTEVGINQTRHVISLKLVTDVNLYLAGASGNVKTTTEVPVAEHIIVGKIPDTYLKATTFQDMMDLVG